MKTLLLLRHAKSSWDDDSLSDFDRPLNERGLNTAPFMGEIMAKRGYIPDLMISSPANRAAKTAGLVRESAGLNADIRYDDRIYEASPQTLIQVASGIDDNVASAMIVGHNPGMEGFIRYLTDRIEPMPTAALAVIWLSVDDWKSIDASSGKIIEIIRPKEEIKSLAV